MKKAIFTFFAAALSFNVAFANVGEFELNEEKLMAEFADLDAIDALVEEGNFTLAQLSDENPVMAASLSDNPLMQNFSIDDMDWGSFAWGFCCWPIGFFVVAINKKKDSDQKLSFWIGMGVSVVLGAIGSIGGAL
jgi:hypothetical protein